MSNETQNTFTDADGATYRALLIPARVQIFRTPPDGAEHAVGTVEKQDLERPMRQAFGADILENGAAPWAKQKATELLGG